MHPIYEKEIRIMTIQQANLIKTLDVFFELAEESPLFDAGMSVVKAAGSYLKQSWKMALSPKLVFYGWVSVGLHPVKYVDDCVRIGMEVHTGGYRAKDHGSYGVISSNPH